VKVVLDAGALIAIDRGDRRVAGLVRLARREDAVVTTTAPVVGQAWRDGARQALLSRTLSMIDVRGVTIEDAKDGGELLKATRGSDIVDALLSLLVAHGDQVLTSDSEDLGELVRARNVRATIVKV
jgi:hypothetical protein